MPDYTVGEFPVVGYYQLKGSSRYILGGKEHMSHAALYTDLERRLRGQVRTGGIQEAISLGYVFKRGGWGAALARLDNREPESSALTSAMWSLGYAAPKRKFMIRFDEHIVRWVYGNMHVNGKPRMEVEADGWDIEFKTAKLRLFFKRMYEDA